MTMIVLISLHVYIQFSKKGKRCRQISSIFLPDETSLLFKKEKNTVIFLIQDLKLISRIKRKKSGSTGSQETVTSVTPVSSRRNSNSMSLFSRQDSVRTLLLFLSSSISSSYFFFLSLYPATSFCSRATGKQRQKKAKKAKDKKKIVWLKEKSSVCGVYPGRTEI